MDMCHKEIALTMIYIFSYQLEDTSNSAFADHESEAEQVHLYHERGDYIVVPSSLGIFPLFTKECNYEICDSQITLCLTKFLKNIQ